MLIRPADFEKTFIQCIVYNFEVLKEYGDEAEVKAKGKVLTKGKDYVVEVRIECNGSMIDAKPFSGWRHHPH